MACFHVNDYDVLLCPQQMELEGTGVAENLRRGYADGITFGRIGSLETTLKGGN